MKQILFNTCPNRSKPQLGKVAAAVLLTRVKSPVPQGLEDSTAPDGQRKGLWCRWYLQLALANAQPSLRCQWYYS